MPEGGELNRVYEALDTRRCAAAGCERRVAYSGLLCSLCWREVPDLLRGQLKDYARQTHGLDTRGQAFLAWLQTAVQAVRVVEATRADEAEAA